MGNGRWWGGTLGRRTSGKSWKQAWRVSVPLGRCLCCCWRAPVLLGLGSRRICPEGPRRGSGFSDSNLGSPQSSLQVEAGGARPSRTVAADLRAQPGPGRFAGEIPRARRRDTVCSSMATSAMLAMQTTQVVFGPDERTIRAHEAGGRQPCGSDRTEPILLPGKSNYIIGNDPSKWHSGIPQFAGVHYASVYPGIDLIFYGNQGQSGI